VLEEMGLLMARVTIVKAAQQRYDTKPVIDPETGQQKVIPVMRRDGSPKKTKRGKEITRRLTEADKTKPLPNRKCGKCGKEITVGMGYKWIKPKSGPYGGSMRVRCLDCPSWRPSETTSSSALSCIYGAQEAAEDALNAWDGETLDDAKSILEDCANGVREGAECWRESAQNIEDGFGHPTSTSEELAEKADNAESSADDMEQTDLEDFDEDAARTEKEDDVLNEYLVELEIGEQGMDYTDAAQLDGFDSEEYERRIEEAIDEARSEWADGIRETVGEAIGNVDF
jgi:hypothetical protein